MLPKREVKDLSFGNDARTKVLQGVEKLYNAVSTTYGPAGQNVLLGLPYGDPTLTRDGVTVAKRTILEDRAENDAATVLRQASEKTNKTAGDGTTATVVLGRNLVVGAHELIAARKNPMVIKRQLDIDARTVIDYLNEQTQSADEHLLEVATVSSGDVSIGALVSDTLKEIGVGGGITIRERAYPTIDVEKINGYYFDKGFEPLQGDVDWDKPLIIVAKKRLSANADVLPIIRWVNEQPTKKIVIVGEVNGEALQTLMINTLSQVDQQGRPVPFEGLVIPPPQYGDEGLAFLEDIAIYVGCSLVLESDKDLTTEHIGSAKQVQINRDRAIIFQGAGDSNEISTRASKLQQQIERETNSHRKDQLESRYAKLVGKIAIVNVGGSTPTAMEEIRYRVEDAIEATKSAMQDGVLPGGGTTLILAAELDISDLFKNALKQTFYKLMDNAAESGEYRYEQVRKAQFGFGFNLRDMTDEPIDLRKSGIWDATRAVIQTIENAVSAAGDLITIGTLVTPRDETKD